MTLNQTLTNNVNSIFLKDLSYSHSSHFYLFVVQKTFFSSKEVGCFEQNISKKLSVLMHQFINCWAYHIALKMRFLAKKVVIDQMFEEAFQSLKNVKIDVLIFQHLPITLIAIALA